MIVQKTAHVVRQPILWNFRRAQAANIRLTLVNCKICVAEPRQKCCTRNARRSAADERNFCRVRLVARGDNLWLQLLRNVHPHENLGCELLKAADVYWPFFARVQIAAADAQIGRRTNHAASTEKSAIGLGFDISCFINIHAKWIVAKNLKSWQFGCSEDAP